MIALIQRSTSASICIGDETVAEIGRGIVALVGFVADDDQQRLARLVERLLGYRIFPDEAGRMNLGLRDIDGEILVVPQFTLAADTDSGNRPSFTPAAEPERGRALFEALETRMRRAWPKSAFGVFGAAMQVALVNDGPVTFWLEV